MSEFVVLLPWCPDVRLSPNGRGNLHPMTRSSLVKKAREDAGWEAVRQVPEQRSQDKTRRLWYAVEIGLPTGQRALDHDNAASWAKAERDGLADALSGGEDRGWVCLGVTQVRDPDGTGYCRFTFTDERMVWVREQDLRDLLYGAGYLVDVMEWGEEFAGLTARIRALLQTA